MSEDLKKLFAELKRAFDSAADMCALLDNENSITKRWLPDKSSRDVFLFGMLSFFLYLSTADRVISEEEVKFMNMLMGFDYSVEDYKVIAQRAKVENGSFADEPPLIIRMAVEFDNLKGGELCETLYKMYIYFGVVCMFADEEITSEEYDRLLAYIEMVYGYIEENKENEISARRPAEELMENIECLTGEEHKGISFTLDKEPSGDVKKEKKHAADDDSKEKSLDELLDELNNLIGLDEVKYDVISLINLVRIRETRERMGLKMPPVSLHLVFSGNPGTGKTTVARLLSQIYHKIGILSKGQLIEVDRSGMVAGYVGQTALKVKDVLEEAKGGVLFIDEAYALTPENFQDDYGIEAIDILVKGMEDNREDLIVIVAGYTKPMQRFIQANPGLKSRFNKFIEFPDYTPKELVQIFSLFCEQNGYRPSRPALDYVYDYFTDKAKNGTEDFANAREARNLFEFAIARQANRIILESDPSVDVLTLIKAEDVMGKKSDMGRHQHLMENAINGVETRRHGIPKSLLSVKLDEMEFSNRIQRLLNKEGIYTIGGILDYMDAGNNLRDLANLGEKTIQVIYGGLKSLGWDGELEEGISKLD